MSIHLFDKYYFDRDPLNWILQVEVTTKDALNKDGTKKEAKAYLKNIAYFGKVEQMAAHIANNAALNMPGFAKLDDLIESVNVLSQSALENIRSKAA